MNSFDLFGNPTSQKVRNTSSQEDEKTYTLPLADLGEGVEEEVRHTKPFFGLMACGAVVVCLLTLQLFSLQIKNASANQALAEGNSIRIITIPADRGLIVDSSGTILAQNSRRQALAINLQTLPTKLTDRESVYQLLKGKAGIDDQTIQSIESNWLKRRGDTLAIKTNISKEESLLYTEWFSSIPCLSVQDVPIRLYSSLTSFGQLVGYTGAVDDEDVQNGYALNERVGKTGLEKIYNSQLSGTAGQQKAEVNAHGEVVRIVSSNLNSEPVAGDTLKLSIDSRLQEIVATALKNELDRRTKKFGTLEKFGASAVVLDPKTGAIKAMVSLPDYSAQLFGSGISQSDYQTLLSNPANPLLNRAIQGQYPPGSTIKPLIAAAGLQAGVITPDTQMVTPEAIYIGDFRFPDWKTHGLTNTRKAIAESNDIFFYAVGGGWDEKGIKGLGIDTLNQYLSKFGLGSKTGVDLSGETAGLLADNAWKQKTYGEKWYIGDTYHSSIGQGYTLATPLQMALGTSAIANGGTVYQPHVAQSWINSVTGTETAITPTILQQSFVSSSNVQVVREGMRQTVLSGSARPLNTLKVTSAGKTGTAQFGNQGLTHAWYTGFAPYDNPELVFSIMIEAGGESFYSSVPVAEEILRGYFNEPLAPGQSLSSSTDVPTDYQGEH